MSTMFNRTEPKTNLSMMTSEALRRAAQEYCSGMLEGGEGFNPFEAELERRELAGREAGPRSSSDVVRELDRLDYTAVREGVEPWASRYARLHAEYQRLAASEAEVRARAFAAEWTAEVFASRRAEWNAVFARYGGRRVSARELFEVEQALGFTLADLKRAKALWS